VSLSLITLALTLRNILQNCGWPIHQIVHNHNTTTACNIHICSVLPPPIRVLPTLRLRSVPPPPTHPPTDNSLIYRILLINS